MIDKAGARTVAGTSTSPPRAAPANALPRKRWHGDLAMTGSRLWLLAELAADLRLLGLSSDLHVEGRGESALRVWLPSGRAVAVGTTRNLWTGTWSFLWGGPMPGEVRADLPMGAARTLAGLR